MRLPRLKKGQPILVNWCDAFFHAGWTDDSLIEKLLDEKFAGDPCQTLGHYWGHKNGKLAIAMTKGSAEDGEIYFIPIANIHSLRILR